MRRIVDPKLASARKERLQMISIDAQQHCQTGGGNFSPANIGWVLLFVGERNLAFLRCRPTPQPDDSIAHQSSTEHLPGKYWVLLFVGERKLGARSVDDKADHGTTRHKKLARMAGKFLPRNFYWVPQPCVTWVSCLDHFSHFSGAAIPGRTTTSTNTWIEFG